jgi:hypothetical protein
MTSHTRLVAKLAHLSSAMDPLLVTCLAHTQRYSGGPWF